MSSDRERRYAEAIRGAVALLSEETTAEDWLEEARAVMAVADAELAELRAEVERLRRELGREAEAHRADLLAEMEEGLAASDALIEALSRAEAAEARESALREALAPAQHAIAFTWERWQDRAAKAAAERDRLREAVGRVRSLHEMQVEMGVQPWCEADGRPWPCPTAAVLADAVPDPTPNTGEGPWRPTDCAVCLSGNAATFHAHKPAASSVDDKAGEPGE